MNPSTKTTITNIEEFSLSGQEVLIISVGEKFKQIWNIGKVLKKIFGEPLSEDELEDINDTINNMSNEEMEKLVKKSEESFDKNNWKYSLN